MSRPPDKILATVRKDFRRLERTIQSMTQSMWHRGWGTERWLPFSDLEHSLRRMRLNLPKQLRKNKS